MLCGECGWHHQCASPVHPFTRSPAHPLSAATLVGCRRLAAVLQSETPATQSQPPSLTTPTWPRGRQFAALLATAKHLTVLTGAGVSAESGIPTFRGAGGLWRKFDATLLATPQAFARDPSQVWEFYHHRREVVARCKPNAAHYALAAAERAAASQGKHLQIITQNIDRLHQAAGSRNVVEMHGSLWDVCFATPTGFRDPVQPPWQDRTQPLVPALANTGDPDGQPADIDVEDLPSKDGRLLRPGVVWFGENLDDGVLETIESVMDSTELLLIVGTSSVVFPAAGYAPQVAQRGVPVVELNLEATGNSDVCALSIQGRAAQLLPELLGVADNPAVMAAAAEAADAAAAARAGARARRVSRQE